jgi:hypothetical protein
MSDIDVSASIDIAADPTDVAGVLFDPQREPDWTQVVNAVELIDGALVPGARVRHHGRWLGQEFAWTTAVDAISFPHLLVLKIDDGPFAGTVRYQVQRAGAGTQARVRLTGRAPALDALPHAVIEPPLRSALTADLERLKRLVEQRA